MEEKFKNLEDVISELENLKRIIGKKKIRDVNTREEKDLIRATAFSWIKTYQSQFRDARGLIDISRLDTGYSKLLEYSDTRTKRTSYLGLIKDIKTNLINLRSELINSSDLNNGQYDEVIEIPDFSELISDPRMISILKKRCIEIGNCLDNDAPLAATVMVGGLLESVLMAKINKMGDKSILFKQKSTPKDGKTSKPKQLSEWMLKDFIDVSNEIKIISKPSAEFSRIIRDYRNYIHPEKELRMGESIELGDAKLFWVVATNLIEQILKS